MQDNGKVIALLIDAENVSPKYIKAIVDEVAVYGTPAYKRIYGDWTSTDMAAWKRVLLEYNLTPIQQFSYTQGKNASDSAMAVGRVFIFSRLAPMAMAPEETRMTSCPWLCRSASTQASRSKLRRSLCPSSFVSVEVPTLTTIRF